MTWLDLLRQKRVQQAPAKRADIVALSRVARRDLADAAVPGLSTDARTGLAYAAARVAAQVAMHAAGYRLRGPRGHETTFEALRLLGKGFGAQVTYFHHLRQRRHALTYDTAGDTTESEAAEALERARTLFADVSAWIREEHPDLAP